MAGLLNSKVQRSSAPTTTMFEYSYQYEHVFKVFSWSRDNCVQDDIRMEVRTDNVKTKHMLK